MAGCLWVWAWLRANTEAKDLKEDYYRVSFRQTCCLLVVTGSERLERSTAGRGSLPIPTRRCLTQGQARRHVHPRHGECQPQLRQQGVSEAAAAAVTGRPPPL